MTCPACGKPTDPKYRPFCSKRCKDLDLSRWLNENYRVPVVEPEESEGDEGIVGDAPEKGES